MVPSNLVTFFAASAGVAGALTGLLFIAISVSVGRITGSASDAQAHRIRAAAALTAFTNSLVVSLFALIPGHKIGPTALGTGLAGLVFVLASLLSLIRILLYRRRHGTATRTFLRDARRALLEMVQGHGSILDLLFLIALAFVFSLQVAGGADVIAHPGHAGSVENLGVLVVACFLIGITRSWELIGGPNLGLWGQVASIVRQDQPEAGDPEKV